MSEVRHTPGPWTFRQYAISDDDLANCKKLGIEPVLMLSNDGQATVMAGDPQGEDSKPVARVECQTKFKRGLGYKTKCAERDANARLIAAAPTMREYIEKRASTGDNEARKILEAIDAGR